MKGHGEELSPVRMSARAFVGLAGRAGRRGAHAADGDVVIMNVALSR
jgi:hypothetical protein